ncbi:HAD-IC family P-type ATPase, partial [Patescibacteria group bacterium]|nr:HAD-IC family P-type ATPase [Patescibacteria group bacterium]
MTKQNWYSLEVAEVSKNLKTDLTQGLNLDEVKQLQEKHGKNSFEKKISFGIFKKILVQFKNPLIFILLIAGGLTILLKEYTDASVIFIALFINTAIGTFQENKASKAFEKLNKSQQKYATVIREGKKNLISVKDLVIGDIVILETGMYVPADIRLFKEKNILVNESVLTGEWADVPKTIETISESKKETLSIINQTNMVWMGTFVTAGYAKGIVIAIGNDTEIGKIAKSLAEIKEEKTPIKENLEKLAHFMTKLVVIALVFIFVIGVVRGESIASMILVAVAIAVAVIPEGMPAAVTSVLAVGMSTILKKGGLVRNLLAAETLGSTTIILTDKTGTITEGKMQLSEIFTLGSIKSKNYKIDEGDNKDLLKMAVLSSLAFIEAKEEIIVRGRPLEKAIVLAGLEKGLSQDELLKENERIDFLIFESANGFSASLHKKNNNKKNFLYVDGIPGLILGQSKFIYLNGKKEKLTDELIEKITKIQEKKSKEGVRFTAIGYKKIDWEKIPEIKRENAKDIIEDLVFVGLIAFSDPIRSNAKSSIQIAIDAGARVIMVTGDNPGTAGKIAEEVGILKKGGNILTGSDVEKMKDKELLEALKTTNVFARMVPSQKMRLSKLLQKNGEVVAMTGDGVNDAPALQSADIGIAMESGTDVAKEASDLILLDGNFSVITYAIEEGRRIIDNLKKIVGYLLSTSFSEIFLIGGSLLVGFPLPILPSQILWSNIVEEGLMNFAFVFEPGEKDLMKRDPRSVRNKNVLTDRIKQMIMITSIVTGFFLLGLYWILMQFDMDIKEVRTIMFVALSID